MPSQWPPKKNAVFDLYVGLRDADGDLITAATGLDSERSIDGAAFADCTNEATEIGTTGMYKLALTAAEMNGDVIIVQIKSTSSGYKTWATAIYTTESTWDEGIDTKSVLTGAITTGSFTAGALNAAAIATDAITAAKLATDAVDEIVDAVWNEDATGHQTQGTFGQAIGDPASDADTIWALVNTNLNATVSSRASQTSVDTIDDFLDTEVAAIKAVTDALPTPGELTSHVLVRTTIATLSTQTFFTLTAGSADDNAYNGCIIVIQDAVTAAQKAVAVILDYAGTTKGVTLLNNPAIFTMAVSDIVSIIANRSLTPTVDNRTLDVSAGGEAGIDWANIGGPTTAQNLSGTNIDVDQVVASVSGAVGSVGAGGITAASIATNAIDADAIAADAVTELQAGLATASALSVFEAATESAFITAQSDLDDIQNRLPAALVTGRMDVSVGAMATNVLTAAALAADAVTEIQAGLGTAAAVAAVQSDTDNIQTRLPAALVSGRMDSSVGAIVTDAINAAAIAANAIDASALAADAVTEIQAGLATSGALATAQADLDDLQTRVPAALVAGRIDSSVGAMAAGTVTAAAIATDAIDSDAIAATAVTEIQTGLATAAALVTAQSDLDNIQTRIPTVLVGGRMDSTVGAMQSNVMTAAATAADFLAEINAEVLDVMATDAVTEPSVGIPPATPSMKTILAYMWLAVRNKAVVNAATGFLEIYNDAGVLVYKKALADVASVFTESESVSG